MEKKITNNDPEWTIWREAFALYERFGNVEKNDNYWEELIEASEKFVKDNKYHLLAQHLAMAIMYTFNDAVKVGVKG